MRIRIAACCSLVVGLALLGCSDTSSSRSAEAGGEYWPMAGSDGQGLGTGAGYPVEAGTEMAVSATGEQWPVAGSSGQGLGNLPPEEPGGAEARMAGERLPGEVTPSQEEAGTYWPAAGSNGEGLGSSMSR